MHRHIAGLWMVEVIPQLERFVLSTQTESRFASARLCPNSWSTGRVGRARACERFLFSTTLHRAEGRKNRSNSYLSVENEAE
jgi:hypothetical protein